MTELTKLSDEELLQKIKDATAELIKRETEDVRAKELKTEKRPAVPGEQIVVTNADASNGFYKKGDIFTVKARSSVVPGIYAEELTEESGIVIFDIEYEVLVKENSLLDSLTEGDSVKYLGGDSSYVFLTAGSTYAVLGKDTHLIRGVPVIKIKDDRNHPTAGSLISSDTEHSFEKVVKKSANEQRAELLEAVEVFKNSLQNAEGFYEVHSRKKGIFYECVAEFSHDSGSRTTTCKLICTTTGLIRKLRTARCHSNDVFHERLGELISLCMCLDIKVPEKFLNAIQPNEFAVGQVILYDDETHIRHGETRVIEKIEKDFLVFTNGNRFKFEGVSAVLPKVIDDTNAVYAT